MPDRSESLIYLYGIVPADAPEPPDGLTGLRGGAVRLARAGGVAGVVGEVPAAEYADEVVESRLGDLEWVGGHGYVHERVLEWYADRGPVVPSSLFSLHRDEGRLLARLAAEEASLRGTLERLRGRREWGIKLWRKDDVLLEHLDALSPALAALAEEIAAAPPGKRFLLGKKRDALRVEEMRAVAKRVAHEVYSRLERLAERAVAVPIPGANGPRVLALHAAYFVEEARFPDFRRGVTEAAAEVSGYGFELEFTGPWPPYHFSDPDE